MTGCNHVNENIEQAVSELRELMLACIDMPGEEYLLHAETVEAIFTKGMGKPVKLAYLPSKPWVNRTFEDGTPPVITST